MKKLIYKLKKRRVYIPHFYVYTISNVGEAMIAKRRTYAELVSYMTAPFKESELRNIDMAGMQMIYGNPDLEPEKSNNFNIAMEHSGRINNAGFFGGKYNKTSVIRQYFLKKQLVVTELFSNFAPEC